MSSPANAIEHGLRERLADLVAASSLEFSPRELHRAAEMAALVVEPVGMADRMAFLGIDHERAITLAKLAVRHDVDAVVPDKPEAGLLALARLDAIVGIAEPAIGGGVGFSAFDDRADGGDGECEHHYLPHAAITSGR